MTQDKAELRLMRRLARLHGEDYFAPVNQLRRMVGRFEAIGTTEDGRNAIRDEDGDTWEWWLSDVTLPGGHHQVNMCPSGCQEVVS